MRYAVVVSTPRNYAALFVLRAAASGQTPEAVLYYSAVAGGTTRSGVRRMLRKVRRIGVLGALNGLRLRRWYGPALINRLECPTLQDACERSGVRLVEIPHFSNAEAQAVLKGLDVDVALSLGNGIIPSAFFSIPRNGMVNVHHEVLPEYRGAQTVLWQLHDGSDVSGYSIHEITDRLDAGRILIRDTVPITWASTLKETVVQTTAAVQQRSVDGLLRLLADYPGHAAGAIANSGRRVYTTPSARAMWRIYRQYWRKRRLHLA